MAPHKNHVEDLDLLVEAGTKAGEIALDYFNGKNEVWHKNGHSPVSEADYAVNEFLFEFLSSARPEYGWLSEETEDGEERRKAEKLFIVDPIDGTRGFIEGRKEWCISVAIVEANRPVVGILECPAINESFAAVKTGGAILNGSAIPKLAGKTLHSLTSSRKLNKLLGEKLGPELSVTAFIPSLAYRIAMVAKGEIDGALARSGCNDWDIAAADLILSEAGGLLTDQSRREPQYNRQKLRHGPLLATSLNQMNQLIALAKKGKFLQ